MVFSEWGSKSLPLGSSCAQFRLPTARPTWLYPILRYHSQDAADYFALPRTVSGSEDFFTADRDLSEFTSEKYGLGWRTDFTSKAGSGSWLRRKLRYLESRASTYTRDDGLDALSLSFGMGVRF